MKWSILNIFFLLPFLGWVQTTIVSEAFSSTAPSGWSSTSSSWSFTYDATATSNSVSGTRSARLSSAATGNGKYIYIPVTVVSGNTYNVTFYTKRACDVTVNLNETANQTTLITSQTQSNSSCSSNFSTWYTWNVNLTSTYSGSAYIQILIGTVYGGPTSVYLDDMNISESTPTSLPIELLYFKVTPTPAHNLIQWCSATETRNWYFSIYRSGDGYVWVPIIKQEGAGTTPNKTYYQTTDEYISEKIVYYKLTQTDFDGSEHECELVSLFNPTTTKQISHIIDMNGRYINGDYKGWVIVIYSDLSTHLIYQE